MFRCIWESGAYQARTCMDELHSCILPLYIIYGGLSPIQTLETLISTDLRETCGYVCVMETYNDK